MNDEQLIAKFAASYHEYHNISVKRRRRQIVELTALSAYLASVGRTLTTLEAGDLEDHMAAMIGRGLAPVTVRQVATMIKPFFHWLWKREMIDADLMLRLRDVRPPRGGSNLPRPYSRKELTQMWKDLDHDYPLAKAAPRYKRRREEIPPEHLERQAELHLGRWRRGQSEWRLVQTYFDRRQMEAIISLALCGGLRQREIFDLRLEDVEPENEYIVVHGARKNPTAESKDRAVPWQPQMRDAIVAWLACREELAPEHDSLWLSLQTRAHYLKPMQHRRFEMLLVRMGGGWQYHRLRHTFATEMLRAGMKLEILSRIMGHARLQQTLVYAQLLSGDIVKAADKVAVDFDRAIGRTKAKAAA